MKHILNRPLQERLANRAIQGWRTCPHCNGSGKHCDHCRHTGIVRLVEKGAA